MALIDLKQVKHGSRFLADVDGAVEKTAVITEPSDVPSDELIPSETYFNAKLDEMVASMPTHADASLDAPDVTPVSEFTLPSIPNDDPVKLIINGLEYAEDKSFTVDRSTGKVVWAGDFPLTADTVDSIKAVYTTKSKPQNSGFPKAKHIIGMVLAEEGAHGHEQAIVIIPDDYVPSDPSDPFAPPKADELPSKMVSLTAKGDWRRIDRNYNEVDFDPNHGTWAGIREVTTNLNGALGKFVEIPTTWVKNEVLQSGPYAGCNCWWIADGEAPGFHVHPSFIKPDGTPGVLRVGMYMATLAEDEVGDSGGSTEVDDQYYSFQLTDYNNLRAKALTYNTDEENGYRAYSIYDHHFLARMILTEFGDPNVFFSSYNGNSYASIDSYHGSYKIDEQPSDAQLMITTNYHGIRAILGDNYAPCVLDGLTTLNGTYQLLAADGSGTMVETGVPCCNGGTWLTNCYMTKTNGVDFGDVFVNDGRNVGGDMDEEKVALGSFCDYQYITNNSAVHTMYEYEYNYCGIFMLNSTSLDGADCWRLVQVL